MRIRISHETVYRYEEPPRGVIQTLRLTPRNHDGQYVESWRIDVSENCQLDQHEDAFGNITHVFTAEGPLSELRVVVDGEVDTQDTSGVVTGAIERFPPSLPLSAMKSVRNSCRPVFWKMSAIVEFCSLVRIERAVRWAPPWRP